MVCLSYYKVEYWAIGTSCSLAVYMDENCITIENENVAVTCIRRKCTHGNIEYRIGRK